MGKLLNLGELKKLRKKKEAIRVLVTACGGNTTLDVVRSLKYGALNVEVIGMDASEEGRMFGAKICEEVLVAPRAEEADFPEKVNELCKKHSIDIIIFSHSSELREIAERELTFTVPTLLPPFGVLRTCADKLKTAKLLNKKGLAPGTIEYNIYDDIIEAFDTFGSRIWVRQTKGSGGRGALLAKKPDHAKHWIDYWRDIHGQADKWILQEYLPHKNISWSSVWNDGEIIASAAMERLEYFISSASISGITGTVSKARTIYNRSLDRLCKKVALCLCPRYHGVLSVDLKEDVQGTPKVTEVETRLTGRPWLSTVGGVNLPEAIVKCLLDRCPDKPKKVRTGLTVHRQLDMGCIITRADGTEIVSPEIDPRLLAWDDEKYARDLGGNRES